MDEEYFEAVGIDLVEGRPLAAGDGAEGTRSAVVSRAFAERWWPGRSPLGRRIRFGGPGIEWFTIVGVVDDARCASLEEPPVELVYWPVTIGAAASPQAVRGLDLVLRTATTDPLGAVGLVRQAVREIHPRIPVSSPRTMDEVVAEASARTSFTASLLGAASGIALLLGLVGIYGVVSYIVAQRTREIGVRMALGATSAGVRGLVVRQGLVLAGIGAVIGLLAAGALSSLMESLLFGVGATDPWTYGSVAALLIAVSAIATWIPAARAASIDPSSALRAD